MRCGLRAGLCLDGMSWHTADDEAAHIVAVALRYMGSGERPTWNEGQPDWTHPDFDPVAHTRCIYCGRKIPDDRTRAGRGVKYCSAECISYAYGKRSRIHMEVVSRREFLAKCAARTRRSAEAEIDCEYCAKPFRPGHRITSRRFCSAKCAQAGKVRRQPTLEPRPCEYCAITFQPKESTRRFCSKGCFYKSKSLKRAA